MLDELDTGSQVCNLIWSLTSHELVSTHGFSSTTAAAQDQICIWKYPTLNMVASLNHTNRVLYLAMSPDGETIVTGAGDETLMFWNAFPKETGRREKESKQGRFGKCVSSSSCEATTCRLLLCAYMLSSLHTYGLLH